MSFLRPCACPGCRKYASPGSSYCDEHGKKRKQERQRQSHSKTRTQRGYSNRWLRFSKVFLMQCPLCAECLRQGRITPATEVDHMIPHKGDPELFWDLDNLQALCHRCHSRKTAREDGGFGRPATPRGSLKKS